MRDYSAKRITELEAQHRVNVERSRKGAIVSATFRHQDGGTAVLMKPHGGTKYSTLQHLPSGQRTWKFCRMLHPKDFAEMKRTDAEQFIRGVHLEVLRSVSGSGLMTRQLSNAAAVRPIEFDSERRKA